MSRASRGLIRHISVVATAVVMASAALVVASVPAGADTVIGGCTIVSNPTTTTHTVCPSADLHGADLGNLDLSYADLDHADLTGANLDQTNLTSADVEYADLTGATNISQFSNTDAEHAILTGDHIPFGCLCGDFTDAHLSGLFASEDGLDPIQVSGTFDGADLSNASFGDVSVTGSFRGANLRGVAFSSGVHGGLGNADFTGADFTNGTIDDSRSVSNLNFTDTTMNGAQLSADFLNTTLTGSTWAGGNMIPTSQEVQAQDATGAVVDWSDPSGPAGAESGLGVACDHSPGHFPLGVTTVTCTVSASDTGTSGTGTFTIDVETNVVIGSCTIVAFPTASSHTSCPGADLSHADLHGYDLSYADLSGANLAQANLQGTLLENAAITGVDFTGANLTGTRFDGTILAVTNRTYYSDGTGGRVLGWTKPTGFALVTGVKSGSCNPVQGSKFPVGTLSVTCTVIDTASDTTGFAVFTETVLPLVEPGAGVVTAPTSGTADLQVTVTLDHAFDEDVTVPWTTLHVSGSPTIYGAPQAPTSDYTASSGTVTFGIGETTAVVHIPVNADTAGGTLPEFIVVSFHGATNAGIGGFYGLGFGIIYPSS
jgi:uncharacterized protein YjbI with pentapeptide repeats